MQVEIHFQKLGSILKFGAKVKTRACAIFLRHNDIQRKHIKPCDRIIVGFTIFSLNIAVSQKYSTSACPILLDSLHALRNVT